MFFKKSKKQTAREYRAKIDKIDRQLSDLEKLARKYQACTTSAQV